VFGMRLGTLGYLSCLFASLALAMLAPGWRIAVVCGLVLALALVFFRAGLTPLRQVWLWVMLAFLILSAALLGDASNWVEGFALGIQMALRAVAIIVAVSGFAASVSIGELAGLLERAGLKGLGFALGVAMNMLPIVQDTVVTTYYALRMRGGFRSRRWQAVRWLLVTIVVNSLRHADDIVSAAEARAFSVTASRPMPVKWQRSDLALAACLVGAVVVVLLV
jgi:energy-coupling factor transporter transmembrane protein EcfT